MKPRIGKKITKNADSVATREYRTHEELKTQLLYYYKEAKAAGSPINIQSMRFNGLRGGRIQLTDAWDELEREGLMPKRQKRKFKIEQKRNPGPPPKPEKKKHKHASGFTRQCVNMYGRKKMINQYKILSIKHRSLSEKFHE